MKRRDSIMRACYTPSLKRHIAFLAFIFCSVTVVSPLAAQSPKTKTIDSIQFELGEPSIENFSDATAWSMTSTPHPAKTLSDSFDITWSATGPGGSMSYSAQASKGTLTFKTNCDVDTATITSRHNDQYLKNYISRDNIFNPNIYIPYIEDDPVVRVTVDYDLTAETHNSITSVDPNPNGDTSVQSIVYAWGNDTDNNSLHRPRHPNDPTTSEVKRTLRYHAIATLRSRFSKTSDPDAFPILRTSTIHSNNGENLRVYECPLYELIGGLQTRDTNIIASDPPQKQGYSLNPHTAVGCSIIVDRFADVKAKAAGTVTINFEYQSPQTSSDLKIASLDMVSPHTLRVNLRGETAKRRDPVKITTTINGRRIEFTTKDSLAFTPGAGNADAGISIDFADWKVPPFTDDIRFKVTASVPDAQATDTKEVGIRLPILFVPGIDPVGGVVGNGRYPGFDNLIERMISSSRVGRQPYLPYNTDYSNGGNTQTANTYMNIFRVDYLRNRASFDEGAQYLNDQWSNNYRNKCWADKFNIVSHSKGTLVTRAMLSDPTLNTYKRANRVVMIQGPHLGSLSPIFDKGGVALTIWPQFKSLLPLWSWQSTDGKTFSIPSAYENQELSALNKRLMNPEPLYKILHSDLYPTDWRHVGILRDQSAGNVKNNLINLAGLKPILGDTIVPTFSQLGIIPGTAVLGFPGGKLGRIAPDQPILPFADLQRRGKLTKETISATHVTVDSDSVIVNILQKFFNKP